MQEQSKNQPAVLMAPPPAATLGTGVVVTGGSSGLGRETALLLAQSGRPVAVWGTNMQRTQDVAQSCREAGVSAVGLVVDVGDQDAVVDAVRLSREAIGKIGGLVCAAACIRGGPVGQINFTDWDQILRTNLTAVAYTLEAVLPVLREVGRGASVVIISSSEGLRGSPIVAAYSASKHGVIGFTRSACLALGSEGIRVNAVCAGAMDTPMLAGAAAEFGDGVIQQLVASIPLGYVSHPREVAQVVCFLLSPEASFVSGTAIPVDGGMMA